MARRKEGSARPKEIATLIQPVKIEEVAESIIVKVTEPTGELEEVKTETGGPMEVFEDEVQSEDAEIPEEVVPAEPPTDEAPEAVEVLPDPVEKILLENQDVDVSGMVDGVAIGPENETMTPEQKVKITIDASEALATLAEIEAQMAELEARKAELEAKEK